MLSPTAGIGERLLWHSSWHSVCEMDPMCGTGLSDRGSMSPHDISALKLAKCATPELGVSITAV